MSKAETKKELNFDELKQNLEGCGYKLISQKPNQPSVMIDDEFVELPFATSFRQVLLEKSGFPKKWQYTASGSKTNKEFLKFLKEKYDDACLSEKIRDIDIDKLGEDKEE